MRGSKLLTGDFFTGETRRVARELIGKWLVSRIGSRLTAGVIVETEAYLPRGDSASHAAVGRTPRNEAMFLEPGRAYVYAIHSRFCFNVVTEPAGVGAAVLIRAIEPRVGLEFMRQRRSGRRAATPSDRELCSGPAKVCEALGIDRRLDRHDLTLGRQLWIAESPASGTERIPMRTTPRIGVTSAKELCLRYVWAAHAFASGPKSWR
ncbi:MAG: DNA-3-methyladenine glycosylase [Planctomycetota bacterium]|jgi:DNA-3-methyladenine glycosylase